jgi:hypothetical protein
MLGACSDAARGARCRLRGENPGNRSEPELWAVVTWSGERARVEVWRSRGRVGVDPPRTREIEFDATNPTLERWRTLGFVTGTLASGLADAGGVPPSASAAESPAPVAPPSPGLAPRSSAASSPAPNPPTRSLSVDIGLGTGPGFDSGPFRLGGMSRVSYAVQRSFITGALGYFGQSNGEMGLSARWLAGSLGAGFRPWRSRAGLGLDVRLEAVVQNVRASISAPPAAGNDADDVWQAGLRAGCDGVWEAVPGISVFLGLDLAGFVGPVRVTVAEAHVAKLPALGGSVSGGLRLTFPLNASRGPK